MDIFKIIRSQFLVRHDSPANAKEGKIYVVTKL